MNRFAPVLRDLADQLPLPQPARARVLLEIAADLEDVFQMGRGSGLDDDAAERLAVETFRPSSAAVNELVRVHGGPLARLMDGLTEQVQTRWERIILAMVAAGTLLLGGRVIVDAEIYRIAGWMATPIVVLTLTAIVIVLAKVYQLALRRDHRPKVLRRGFALLFGASVAQGLLGFVAAWAVLFIALGSVADQWPQGGQVLMHGLRRGSALLTLALEGALVSALSWFALNRRVARIEEQEAELLFQLERS